MYLDGLHQVLHVVNLEEVFIIGVDIHQRDLPDISGVQFGHNPSQPRRLGKIKGHCLLLLKEPTHDP